MASTESIKRRLGRIEASTSSPDEKTYFLSAREGEPCLGVTPPWGGTNIICVLSAQHRNVDMPHYDQALRNWEQTSQTPPAIEDDGKGGEERLFISENSEVSIPFHAIYPLIDGATRGRLPSDPVHEHDCWSMRVL